MVFTSMSGDDLMICSHTELITEVCLTVRHRAHVGTWKFNLTSLFINIGLSKMLDLLRESISRRRSIARGIKVILC